MLLSGSCHLRFRTFIGYHLCENKAKLRALNSCWSLNRGNNNRRTITGMAKRRPRPLNSDGRLTGVILFLAKRD